MFSHGTTKFSFVRCHRNSPAGGPFLVGTDPSFKSYIALCQGDLWQEISVVTTNVEGRLVDIGRIGWL